MLAGSGASVQWEGEDDPSATRCARATASCTSRSRTPTRSSGAGRAGRRSRSASGSYAPGITWLPRAGVAWLGETWAPVGAEDDHPWTREAAAGPPEVARALAASREHRQRRRRRGRRARERHARPSRAVPEPRGRLAPDGPAARRGVPGQAQRAAALPLGRGGDLRRARRRRPAAALGGGRRDASIRFAPAPSSAARRAPASRTPSAGATAG